jgi:tripartite-type tricarboxylate transporter receptor subunit TctC
MRRTKWTRVRGGLMAVVLLLTAACAGTKSTAAGGEGEGSFEGETIHFIVSFSPGGGYDIVARAIAPYLEDELGATVVVENEDGAGGLVAANEVYTAEPDGTTIGFFAGQGIAGAQLGGADGAQFDLLNYSYVARIAADPRVIVTGPDSPYKTIDDVLAAHDLKFATAGTGAADNIDATVLIPVLGMDAQIVTGYESSDDTALALQSGDVDLGSGTVSSRLPDIKSGEMRPLLIIGDHPVKELPGVPVLTDMDLSAEEMSLAQAHIQLQALGRMVWAPPEVPDDRLAALEDAFEAACSNPEFLKKMEKAYQGIDFTPGAEAKEVAEETLDAPDNYTALLQDAYENQ